MCSFLIYFDVCVYLSFEEKKTFFLFYSEIARVDGVLILFFFQLDLVIILEIVG